MPRVIGRLDATQVADPGAVVDGGVGVEYFAPTPGAWQPDPVLLVRVPAEVRYAENAMSVRTYHPIILLMYIFYRRGNVMSSWDWSTRWT